MPLDALEAGRAAAGRPADSLAALAERVEVRAAAI